MNEEFHFAWVGPMPEDPRGLKSSLIPNLNSELENIRERALIHAVADANSIAFDYDMNRDPNEAYSSSRQEREEAISRNVTESYTRATSRIQALDTAIASALAQAYALDLDITLARARVIEFDLALTRINPSDHNHTLDLDRARALVLDLALQLGFGRLRSGMFDNAFSIFIDLYTLYERITGRCHPFEGIRLVKEQMR
jgi:hypothetical protein